METEPEMLAMETVVPVYFAVEDEALLSIYEQTQAASAAQGSASAAEGRLGLQDGAGVWGPGLLRGRVSQRAHGPARTGCATDLGLEAKTLPFRAPAPPLVPVQTEAGEPLTWGGVSHVQPLMAYGKHRHLFHPPRVLSLPPYHAGVCREGVAASLGREETRPSVPWIGGVHELGAGQVKPSETPGKGPACYSLLSRAGGGCDRCQGTSVFPARLFALPSPRAAPRFTGAGLCPAGLGLNPRRLGCWGHKDPGSGAGAPRAWG